MLWRSFYIIHGEVYNDGMRVGNTAYGSCTTAFSIFSLSIFLYRRRNHRWISVDVV